MIPYDEFLDKNSFIQILKSSSLTDEEIEKKWIEVKARFTNNLITNLTNLLSRKQRHSVMVNLDPNKIDDLKTALTRINNLLSSIDHKRIESAVLSAADLTLHDYTLNP